MSKLYLQYKQTLPHVEGKVFAITGTTSGTGFVAAQTVAELGGEVLLLNRPSERAKKSLESLKNLVPNGKFIPIDCDLQDFESVRKAASEIKAKYNKLYCLANNSGIMATPDEATKDGYDTQMQTNHLSHFLLTAELLPLLEEEANNGCGEARIVNHSSGGRHATPKPGLEEKYFLKNGGNLGGNGTELSFIPFKLGGPNFLRYFQTKLANSVFTQGLHQKLQNKGSKVKVIACHPGVASTNLADDLDLGWPQKMIMPLLFSLISQKPDDGALGLIKGMVDPTAESGVLYGPPPGAMTGEAVPNPPKPYETDPEAIEMLFRTSEQATGVKF